MRYMSGWCGADGHRIPNKRSYQQSSAETSWLSRASVSHAQAQRRVHPPDNTHGVLGRSGRSLQEVDGGQMQASRASQGIGDAAHVGMFVFATAAQGEEGHHVLR